MKLFKKRFSLSPEQRMDLIRAREERIEAEKKRTRAESLKSILDQIREENHFSMDFRKALGER